MTRVKAASTHFAISVTLSAIVICLLIFGWYQYPYFVPLGGLLLVAMIVGIDMVLGPLMTLILFNAKKSRRALMFDLTLIAIVQLGALGYGLYSGYVSRIVFKVFDGTRFHLVQADEVLPNFLARTKSPEYSSLPYWQPKYAMAVLPDDLQARNDMVFYRAFGLGVHSMPHYYVPLQHGRKALAGASLKREALLEKTPGLAAEIDTFLAERNLDWTRAAVIPFEVKTRTYTAIVRLDPVEMLKVLPEDPR